MAAVALGHRELFNPVDQVRVVAVTPCRLDDEGLVFEGNEASAEEAAQANLIQQTFPRHSLPFSFFSLHFSFFSMDTEGSAADPLLGRYRITSNHFCKGQMHFGNSQASVSMATATSFLFVSSNGGKHSAFFASGLMEIYVPNCTCPLESLCDLITRSCAAVTGGTICFLFYYFSGTFHNGKQTRRQ